jgi:hypothetical protein
MGSLNVQTYLWHRKRSSKIFGFGPKLVELGKVFSPFSLFNLFFIYAEEVEDNQKVKSVICSSMASL